MADTQDDAELRALVTQMQIELEALRRRVQQLEQHAPAATPPLAQTRTETTPAAAPLAPPFVPASAPAAPRPSIPPPIPAFLQAPPISNAAPASAGPLPAASDAAHEPTLEDVLTQRLRKQLETPQPARPQSPLPPPIDVREKLRALRLWPPADGAEGALGAWWASRLGMLMALIGLVSFSAYMQVSPIVRFLELLAAALAITAAGWRLERTSRAFGRVVFAGGMATLYFTSFAAHAVPATRVIESPTTGTLLQAAVAAALMALARWRRAPGLAVLMLGFGYLAGMFGIFTGMRPEGLLIGCGFAAIALALHLHSRWPAPLLVAMPLTHLLYLVLAWGYWMGSEGAGVPLWIMVGYPAAMLALFCAADLLRPLDAEAAPNTNEPLPGGWDLHASALPRLGRRVALLCNSSLALAGAWPVMYAHHHAQMHPFYFLFAGLCGAASAAWFMQGRGDGVAQAYGFKASALAVLGVVAWLDGLARWVAVFAESWLIALAARRTRWRIYLAAAVLAWLVAIILCGQWIVDTPATPTPLSVYGWPGALLFALAFGSAALMAALQRWFAAEFMDTPADIGDANADADGANVGAFVLGLLPGGALLVLAKLLPATQFLPTTLMLMAALIALAARLLAVRAVYAGALPLGLMAYIDYCVGNSLGNGPLLINLAVLLLPGAGALLWLLASPRADDHDAHERRIAARTTAALATLALTMYLLRMHSLALAIVVALGMGGVLLIAGTQRGRVSAAHLALLPPLLLPLALMLAVLTSTGQRPWQQGPDGLLWLGALLGYGLALLAAGWPPHRTLLERGERLRSAAPHVWVGVAYTTLALVLEHRHWPTALPLAAMLMLQAAWRTELRALRQACLMPVVLGFLALLALHLENTVPLLARGLVCALLLLAYGLCAAMQMRRDPDAGEMAEAGIEFFAAFLTAPALLTALWVLLEASGTVHYFVTASWSLVAIVVFAAGLALRLKYVRALALGTFGLAILRVFAVDARSAFDRIVAFLALGVILLIVGFLYHRFGARLRREPR